MKYDIDMTSVLKAIIENLPKEQVGVVVCYLGTITVGCMAYKYKLDHDFRMAELKSA